MSMHLLLIEQRNLPLAESMVSSLAGQDFTINVVHSLETAVKKTKTLWPNLVVFCPVDDSMSFATFQQQFADVDLEIPYIVVASELDHDPNSDKNIKLVSPNPADQLTSDIVGYGR